MVTLRASCLVVGIMLCGAAPDVQANQIPMLALYNAVTTTGMAFAGGYNGWDGTKLMSAIAANSSVALTVSALVFIPRFMEGRFTEAFTDPIGILVTTVLLAPGGWALGRLTGSVVDYVRALWGTRSEGNALQRRETVSGIKNDAYFSKPLERRPSQSKLVTKKIRVRKDLKPLNINRQRFSVPERLTPLVIDENAPIDFKKVDSPIDSDKDSGDGKNYNNTNSRH